MPLARARAIRGGCGRTVRLVRLTLEIKAVAGSRSQKPIYLLQHLLHLGFNSIIIPLACRSQKPIYLLQHLLSETMLPRR